MRGLNDSRFEVRFSCGRALSKICSSDPTLSPAAESVYAATLHEIATAKRLSETPKVIDRYEDQADSTRRMAHHGIPPISGSNTFSDRCRCVCLGNFFTLLFRRFRQTTVICEVPRSNTWRVFCPREFAKTSYNLWKFLPGVPRTRDRPITSRTN